jgi:hypothetical protein
MVWTHKYKRMKRKLRRLRVHACLSHSHIGAAVSSFYIFLCEMRHHMVSVDKACTSASAQTLESPAATEEWRLRPRVCKGTYFFLLVLDRTDHKVTAIAAFNEWSCPETKKKKESCERS